MTVTLVESTRRRLFRFFFDEPSSMARYHATWELRAQRVGMTRTRGTVTARLEVRAKRRDIAVRTDATLDCHVRCLREKSNLSNSLRSLVDSRLQSWTLTGAFQVLHCAFFERTWALISLCFSQLSVHLTTCLPQPTSETCVPILTSSNSMQAIIQYPNEKYTQGSCE